MLAFHGTTNTHELTHPEPINEESVY